MHSVSGIPLAAACPRLSASHHTDDDEDDDCDDDDDDNKFEYVDDDNDIDAASASLPHTTLFRLLLLCAAKLQWRALNCANYSPMFRQSFGQVSKWMGSWPMLIPLSQQVAASMCSSAATGSPDVPQMCAIFHQFVGPSFKILISPVSY